ncbi:MAG: formate--tetrahydrofolate ligase [Oscillospiraceae bacterium]
MFVHGGPFANIAHGCNSVTATRMAMRLGDYAVTEAGFGADLGASSGHQVPHAGLKPNAVVLVATVRALKLHGGVSKTELDTENLAALEQGAAQSASPWDTIKNTFHLPCVVAINAFPTNTAAELRAGGGKVSGSWASAPFCRRSGPKAAPAVLRWPRRWCACARSPARSSRTRRNSPSPIPTTPLIYKLNAIVNRVYGGAQAILTPAAQKQAKQLFDLGFGDLPVCMAKTQYSLSDDPTLLGAPEGFTVTVRSLRVSAGAGFIVALTGDIMTMPGLPKTPAAEKIDVDETDASRAFSDAVFFCK